MTKPTYCIIEPGTLSDNLVADHGDYARMGVDLLSECIDEFEYHVCTPVRGEALPEAGNYHGCLIMGSEHGVNDDLPWLEPLFRFIRDASSQKLPLVGICFGHQAIARALGGAVERRDWNVGVDEYRAADGQDLLKTIVYHQDQVVRLPDATRLEFASDNCPNASLGYLEHPCWTIQSHPEFTKPFAWDLFEQTRYDPLTDDQCDSAKTDLGDFEADLGYIRHRIRQTFLGSA